MRSCNVFCVHYLCAVGGTLGLDTGYVTLGLFS